MASLRTTYIKFALLILTWTIQGFFAFASCTATNSRTFASLKGNNQSILKEISPGCSLEGLMLSWNSNTLATSCEELTHWKRLWCWEGLWAGGEGDNRGWDGWMASQTRWTWVWVNSVVGDGQGGLACCNSWVAKSRTRLSDWTELNWCTRPEKAMAPHSSTLAWKIPWMKEHGGLQSMGSRRVRHDWVTSLSPFAFMYWRRKWHPTPVFLPGESQGCGTLVGCHLWYHTESDTTEAI